MKSVSSNYSLKILHSFLVTLILFSSVCHTQASNSWSSSSSNLKLISTFFHILWVFLFWSTAIRQFESQTRPSIIRLLLASSKHLVIRTHSSCHIVLSRMRFFLSFQFGIEFHFIHLDPTHFHDIFIIRLLPHIVHWPPLVVELHSAW